MVDAAVLLAGSGLASATVPATTAVPEAASVTLSRTSGPSLTTVSTVWSTFWRAFSAGLVKMEFHSASPRSEEHTAELQSRGHLVCRLLLEKQNKEQH